MKGNEKDMDTVAEINDRIIDKIDNSEEDEVIKEFLKKIFIFELSRTKGDGYKNEYMKKIENHTDKWSD